MKLVDILARELKVWPAGVRSVTQQDNGNLCDEANYPLDIPATLSSYKSDVVTYAEWKASAAALGDISPSLYIQQSGRCFRALSSDPDDIARAHVSNLIYGAMSKLGQAPTVDQVSAAASALVDAGYQQFEIIDEPKS